MHKFVAAVAIALAASACTTQAPQLVEEGGYKPGALGLAAIEQGDWTLAEAQLQELRGLAADDPARLINLGRVYVETGRSAEARAAFEQALASDRHFLVRLGDGSVASTRDVAQQAFVKYNLAAVR